MSMPGDRSGRGRPVSDMADVDRSGHAGSYVEYLHTAKRAPDDRSAIDPHVASFLALNLEPGDAVLDVGCGLGEEVLTLAEIVGPTGRAVGLDNSQTMIDEANQRASGKGVPVEYVVGSAYDLPFEDGSFDACREELMLQHLHDPTAAISEMVRVTRSEGRISVTEPDWELWVVDAPDRSIFRRLREETVDSDRGGSGDKSIGRQLYRLLGEAGLQDLAVIPIAIPYTDLAQANTVIGVLDAADRARDKGVITEDERLRWHESLREADAKGQFFAALGGFTVVGTRP